MSHYHSFTIEQVVERCDLYDFLLGNRRYALVTSAASGKRMLVTHSTKEGRIDPLTVGVALHQEVAAVACCFPVMAQLSNPELPVVGDWKSKSAMYMDGQGCVEYGPSTLMRARHSEALGK